MNVSDPKLNLSDLWDGWLKWLPPTDIWGGDKYIMGFPRQLNLATFTWDQSLDVAFRRSSSHRWRRNLAYFQWDQSQCDSVTFIFRKCEMQQHRFSGRSSSLGVHRGLSRTDSVWKTMPAVRKSTRCSVSEQRQWNLQIIRENLNHPRGQTEPIQQQIKQTTKKEM